MTTEPKAVNAEEAVIPVRTVVIILFVLVSIFVSAAIVVSKATTQWDSTQERISKLTDAIDDFKKLIEDRTAVRDKQFAEVDRKIQALNDKVDLLTNQQDTSHDETMGKINSVNLQVENLMIDFAHFKCKIRPTDCAPMNVPIK